MPGEFTLGRALHLQAQGPRAALVWPHDIVERLNVSIDCLSSNVQDFAAPAAYPEMWIAPPFRGARVQRRVH
jgi:hypothetical protein